MSRASFDTPAHVAPAARVCRALRRASAPVLLLVGVFATACNAPRPTPATTDVPRSEPVARSDGAGAGGETSAAGAAGEPGDSGPGAEAARSESPPVTDPVLRDASAAPAPTDPLATHYETTDDLKALVFLPPPKDDAHARRRDTFLAYNFGQGPGRFNQGRKAIAGHAVSKAKCLEGLGDAPLQTDEQKATCGAEYMVPVHKFKNGVKEPAKYCIDQFEFPNKPCELPMVWTAPSAAMTVCGMQGKRLCTQDEWSVACRADPEGGPDSVYAYGDELDMTICNTNKPHPATDGRWNCVARDAQSAWQTCATETEPAGAFPKCRSRFGVFDQHGNVAEVMTRIETGGDAGALMVSQLKGSAFFYVDVARKHNEAQPKDAPRETYPDHCNYDPRWHVEPMSRALHVNYHLGFRCCKSL